MNGLNSIGGAPDAAAAAQGGDALDFDTVFQQGLVNTSIIMLQLVGGDIIQSVMKDESAVD